LTRLKPADVLHIPRTLEQYEKELRNKTGCSLLQIAEDAANTKKSVGSLFSKSKAAVVPITAGRGAIEGFSDAVAAILNHIGLPTVITRGTDVVGIGEAYAQEADVVFVADDIKFVAINTRTMRVVDNATATAKAYVAALSKMAGGLMGKRVLVIGAGNVGTAAVSNLILRGAKPLAVDIDRSRLKSLKARFGGRVAVFDSSAEAVRRTSLIINTAPVRNLIHSDMIHENTVISNPAIPLCLTEAALSKVGRNVLHDPLQLGVATMAVEACAD